MKRFWLAWTVLLCAAMPVQAGRVLNDTLATRPFRHHIWQEVLIQSVDSRGQVDFARLRAYPLRLNQYLTQLAAVSPDSDPSAFPTSADQAAYWINAHNAIALRIVLNHYPLKSLDQIDDREMDYTYRLGGVPYSLPKIRERALKLRQFPQTFFTLTEYAQGTPPILPTAYEGKTLKAQALTAMRRTLAEPQLVRFERRGGFCARVSLSPFFRSDESVLFSPPPQAEEDRDALDENAPASGYPQNWKQVLQPFAPPAYYDALGRACSTVEFMPPNATLRQLEWP